MTNAQYDCFLAVVETGSVSEAAHKLFVAQPAVSRQLHAMEEEISVKLFSRKGRKLCLTTEGMLLYDMICENKRRYNETVQKMQLMAHSGERQEIKLGCPVLWNTERAYWPIEDWTRNRYPWYNLTLSAHNQQEILSMVADGRLDLAMHTEDAVRQDGLITEHFRDADTMLVFSAKSMLARNPELLKGSSDFTLLTTFNLQGHVYRELKELLLTAMGVSDIRLQELPNIPAVYEAMEDPNTIFLASAFSIWKNDPLLRNIILPVRRKIFLSYRAEESVQGIRFLAEHLISEFRESKNSSRT